MATHWLLCVGRQVTLGFRSITSSSEVSRLLCSHYCYLLEGFTGQNASCIGSAPKLTYYWLYVHYTQKCLIWNHTHIQAVDIISFSFIKINWFIYNMRKQHVAHNIFCQILQWNKLMPSLNNYGCSLETHFLHIQHFQSFLFYFNYLFSITLLLITQSVLLKDINQAIYNFFCTHIWSIWSIFALSSG